MFTSTMPFRIQLDAALDACSLMKHVGAELMNFYFHQKYPYDLLASDLELAQKDITVCLVCVLIITI